jgi:D-glycero-D-manno-heptose 1,7-bisphosphate phosphatase
MTEPRPAVFLDRDGTLMEEVGYCSNPADVRVFPGVAEALERLRARGFLLFIVTNQSGIGQGFFDRAAYEAVHAELCHRIAPARVDGVYFSPDAPESESPRRKPEPGMVLEAAADHGVDLARSYFVGDRISDIECGRRAGTRTILVGTGYGRNQADCAPDYRAPNLVDAVRWILAQTPAR